MTSASHPTGPFTCEIALRRIRAPQFVREDKQGATYMVARGYELGYETVHQIITPLQMCGWCRIMAIGYTSRQPSPTEVPMRRIGLAVLLTLTLLVPLVAEPQPTGKVDRIGVLSEGPRSSVIDRMLPPALRALGWVENENFVFERRYAEGRPDRLPELAADLVRAKPDRSEERRVG